MLMGAVDNEKTGAEANTSLRADRELLGLTLDTAIRLSGNTDMIVEYTRPIRNASDNGTPRVVRVKDGVITAAFFCDTVSEVDI